MSSLINTTLVRPLTAEQQARMKEALRKLHAPWVPGEPMDEPAWTAARVERLRADYPDVAELIGCGVP